MSKSVTFRGSPLNLAGRVLKIGADAPEFRVVSADLKPVSLADFKGKVKVIHSFPSLDTPVCDLQVKEFNKRATGLSEEVIILGISKDLPFAQKRFCDSNNIKNVIVLSDYNYSSFGINYGLLVKELNLLARAVLILDKNNILRYLQIAPEMTSALDFDDCLGKLGEVIKSPSDAETQELPSRCKPCEEGALPLPKEKIETLLAKYRGWELKEARALEKKFKFQDFSQAKYFVDLIAIIAEEQGHHPGIAINYNRVKITLFTHAAGGLTDNDFIMAKIIDQLEV